MNGQAEYPSFVEWMEGHYEQFLQVHAPSVVDRFKSHDFFESVDLMNIHEDIDFLENFFCNYFPNAFATCQAIRQGEQSTRRDNVGGDHEYERLVVKASTRGFIKKLSRYEVRPVALAIEKAVTEQNIYSEGVPKTCLSETFLKQLLQKEINQERKLFPEWYESHGGDDGIRVSFEKAKLSKFCSMDVDKILESGVLNHIFKEHKE